MKAFLLSLLLLVLLPVLRADDVLFIGNSFTYTYRVPLQFEAIAAAKGKTAKTGMWTKGGIGWGWHLKEPNLAKTDTFLKSKAWNFVAIQDYSTNATHLNFRHDFFKNGEILYDKIGTLAPTATLILYETWSFPSAVEGYVRSPNAKPDDDKSDDAKPDDKKDATVPPTKPFKSQEEMFGEIHSNYEKLFEQLKAKDPKRKILYAPVGTAFAACQKAHPEIILFGPDGKHPTVAGAYLSACVFYAVIYNESPLGGGPPVGKNVTMDPAYEKPLQEIAAAIVLKGNSAASATQPVGH